MRKNFYLSWLLIVWIPLLLVSGCEGNSDSPKRDHAAPETRLFTDSTGRTVTIPKEVTRIAVSGPLSEIYVVPLAGDLLVGVSTAYPEDMREYLPAYLYEIPEMGQLYGGKGELDLEALLLADPDVVVDVGDAKDTAAEDMNALTEQTGIPFIHIDASVESAPSAYRKLGELFSRQEKAEELAVWCEKTYSRTVTMMDEVDANGDRKSLLYCLGDAGLNVIARGSFHGETIDLMSSNVAELHEVVASGLGNEVDLEQIMVWDPEILLFAPDSICDQIPTLPEWQNITAVSSGSCFKTPCAPYGWLSSPPSVQRYLGILWLGELLYPDYVTYDLQEEVTQYYDLFYGCNLTSEMYQEMMRGAIPS